MLGLKNPKEGVMDEIVRVTPVCPSCLKVALGGICPRCQRQLGLNKRGTTTTVLAKFCPPEAYGLLPLTEEVVHT